MRILFASTGAYPPQNFGGIEVSVDTLSCALHKRAHDVAVVAKLERGDLVWAKNRFRRRTLGFSQSAEQLGDYTLYRDTDVPGAVEALVDDFHPDILVIHSSGKSRRLISKKTLRVPVAVHFHSLTAVKEAKQLYEAGVRHFICCSNFLAGELARSFTDGDRPKISVIYNLFDHDNHRVNGSPHGRYITFVNPIRKKGVEIAIDVASSMPEASFLFVKAWRPNANDLLPLTRAVRKLRNITVKEASPDMKSVYGATRVLMLPSQVQEGGPRVILEAQINGIPVIASDRGGTKELIGDGGILLPHDDNAAWTKTVRTVFHDAVEWQRLSRAARRNSLHRRFSLENTLTKYENFLSACVEDHTLPRIAEPRYREEPLLGLREELSA